MSNKEVVNNSGIHPVGYRVLVLPDVTERKTESGIILHDTYANREDMAQIEATVIEIGESCWAETIAKGFKPWCKVGDKIMIAKYSGLLKEGRDKKMYRIINDLDVVGALSNE